MKVQRRGKQGLCKFLIGVPTYYALILLMWPTKLLKFWTAWYPYSYLTWQKAEKWSWSVENRIEYTLSIQNWFISIVSWTKVL